MERLSRNLDYFKDADLARNMALQVARESLSLSLTVSGLRDLALKHELMAKLDLT